MSSRIHRTPSSLRPAGGLARASRAWAFALAASLLAATAHATGPEPHWHPVTAGSMVSTTGMLTAPGSLLLQPMLYGSLERGSFDGRGSLLPLAAGESAQLLSLQLFVEYGLAQDWTVGLTPGLAWARRTTADASASSVGLTDPSLFVRYGLQTDGNRLLPEAALLLLVKAPLGSYQHLDERRLGTDGFGNGAWELGFGINFSKAIWPVFLHSDLLVYAPIGTEIDGVPTRYMPWFAWTFTVELPLLGDRFVLLAEVNGRHQADLEEAGVRVPGSRTDDVTLGVGVEWIASDSLQLLLGYQRTLWGRNGVAVDSLVFTVVPGL